VACSSIWVAGLQATNIVTTLMLGYQAYACPLRVTGPPQLDMLNRHSVLGVLAVDCTHPELLWLVFD
jgi:hypothetical protein